MGVSGCHGQNLSSGCAGCHADSSKALRLHLLLGVAAAAVYSLSDGALGNFSPGRFSPELDDEDDLMTNLHESDEQDEDSSHESLHHDDAGSGRLSHLSGPGSRRTLVGR